MAAGLSRSYEYGKGCTQYAYSFWWAAAVSFLLYPGGTALIVFYVVPARGQVGSLTQFFVRFVDFKKTLNNALTRGFIRQRV